MGARDPDVGDLARLAPRAAYALAKARIARRRRDAALVAAEHLDLGGIDERADHLRIADQHPIANRHEVDCVPDRPPAPAPVLETALGRAARLEGAQDMQAAIEPE